VTTQLERTVAQVEGWILSVPTPTEIKVIASNAVK
jgi:hypothetical protein